MGCSSSKPDVAQPDKPKKDSSIIETAPVPVDEVAAEKAAAIELESSKARAATKMQAQVRGKQGRQVVPPLKLEPCNRYRVNVQAENFGDCLCGWCKAEHKELAFVANPEHGGMKRLDSEELRERMTKKEYADCDHYRVNMQSENFGDCICGRPKNEHSEAALQGEKPMTPTIVDSEAVRARMLQKEKTSCTQYRVNMQAANFGECICGRPKAEHTDEALKGAEREHQAVDEDELRKKMTSKEMTDCADFRLDMDPSAPFGQCVCGRPKKEHKAEAIKTPVDASFGKKRDSAEVREKMLQRETVACTKYRLDMNPAAPFGQCECGEPKALHSAAALSSGGERRPSNPTGERLSNQPPASPVLGDVQLTPEKPASRLAAS